MPILPPAARAVGTPTGASSGPAVLRATAAGLCTILTSVRVLKARSQRMLPCVENDACVRTRVAQRLVESIAHVLACLKIVVFILPEALAWGTR